MTKRIPILLGLILLAIAIWVQTTSFSPIQHVIDRLESLAYDIQLRTKLYSQPTPTLSPIAIIDVDDKSLAKEGRWPWQREHVARLIHRLQEMGAVVIALDIIFPENELNIVTQVLQELNQQKLSNQHITSLLEKLRPSFDGDAKLAGNIARSDVILGVSFLPRSTAVGALSTPVLSLKTAHEKQLGLIDAPGMIGNISTLQSAAKGAGFINVFPDSDGIIRRVPILIRYKDSLYPSLALEAVRQYLLSNITLITADYDNQIRLEGVKVGNYVIPTDEKSQVIVPFVGKSFTFPYYSATDVLNNAIPAHALEGKIIFIGTSATGLGDLKATAIESIFPGVEIQATIAHGILANSFTYKPAWASGAELFITIFIGIILLFTFPYLGPRSLSLFIFLIPALLIFINVKVWQKTGLIISIFIPILFSVLYALINMIYGYLFETRRRERLKEMFGQYVPTKHIDEMLKSNDSYGLYGEDREMTVLFADIRNFTTLSENMTGSQLKEMLNQFFTPMTEIIFKHRGTIDKYVGDLVMAFWGAPLKDKKHAFHAIQSALEMQIAVKKLAPYFLEQGLPEINIGIGLNTGIMSVGDMGSRFRRNYTVLGDAVNLASRVEGLTKFYGAEIIVTEHTQENQTHFFFRELDRVKVKGKDKSISIYEVLCTKKEVTPELKKEVLTYHTALEHYFKQEWDKAEILLTELQEQHPHNKLYKLYLHRIEEFRKSPPPEDWDGVFVHTMK